MSTSSVHIPSQRQRRLVNRLYGSHHDRPRFKLARSRGTTNNPRVTTKKVNGKERTIEEEIFDKSSDRIARLVNKIWLCRYPRCCYLIYDNGSEFKLHFETLCDSYGIKRKPTTIKNPQTNAICERVHQVLGTMMRTAELDMADSVYPADIDTFIDNAVWAIRSTYHTVLKASQGAAIFG